MKRTITILFVFLIFGCEELIDSTHTKVPPMLAVEGIITNERINHRIRLTLLHDIQNAAAEPATGAIVTLTNGKDIVTLQEVPENSGDYYTPEFRAITGQTYTLAINYQNHPYTASDASIPVSPLEPLRFFPTMEGYRIIEGESGNTAAFTDHRISWEHTDVCTTPGECRARIVSYDLQNIDVNEIFKPESDVIFFPQNSVVIRKKYSASPAFRDYLRGMMSETRWRGGVFDVPRANPGGNILGNAVGFFAVSTVVSDTTILR